MHDPDRLRCHLPLLRSDAPRAWYDSAGIRAAGCRSRREIDLALLLHSRSVPAQRYASPALLGLRWFLLVRWADEAEARLLPQLPLLGAWARGGIGHILAAASGEP